MTISRRALDWFSSLLQAALVVALVPATLALAECPGDSCDQCKTCPLQTVDWTAIFLGDFATGCALTNPDPTRECQIDCNDACIASTTESKTWCPGPSIFAHGSLPDLPFDRRLGTAD